MAVKRVQGRPLRLDTFESVLQQRPLQVTFGVVQPGDEADISDEPPPLPDLAEDDELMEPPPPTDPPPPPEVDHSKLQVRVPSLAKCGTARHFRVSAQLTRRKYSKSLMTMVMGC